MALLDFLKTKELKQEIENLKNENSKLNENVESLKSIKLSTEQMTLIELQDSINNKTLEQEDLNNKIQNQNSTISEKQQEIIDLENKIKKLEKQLAITEDDLEMESFGLYKPRYDFANSLTYKAELDKIRKQQKEFIKTNAAVNFLENWTIDGSKAKGRKFTKDNIKMILRAFNNECEASINKVKAKNLQSIEKRISKSFEQINKLNETNRCSITTTYYDLKISELYLAYEYERKKEEEKEALREQREKEREEKALQKEVDSKKKIIDKEIKHLNNVVAELELRLTKNSDSDAESLKNQISELKERIHEQEEEKKDLDYRLVHASAGYVYIISNIGSFGEDVFKIGVTRRLDPMDRINELSSASVPFKFDTHALIFSYDAYGLESELHEKFANQRMNMVNNRKEFFKLTIEDIKNELNNYKDLTIDFNEMPDAEEFNESQSILKNKTLKEIRCES